jgi:uncharacterized membrane protein YcaP (DUF421 family)
MPDWLIIIGQSLLLLLVLFLLTKLLGTKHISQMNIFEYISGIVLGGIVAVQSVDPNSNIVYGILAMLVWFIVPFGVEYVSLKSKKIRDLTQGKSTIFIQDGKIMEDNLKKEGYSADDLLEKLRDKDIFLVSDVEFAVLEPSGSLNVLPKKENLPLTPKDLGIAMNTEKQPETVIMDGKIMYEPLANLSLSKDWLETELEKLNVSLENVFLGQADREGQLTVDLYDDQIVVPSPSEKPLLLASLKKCQADLELFALQTDNKSSKQLYENNSKKVQQVIDQTTSFLQ